MAPVARAPAMGERPGGLRGPRRRIRGHVRAVAAVVGAAECGPRRPSRPRLRRTAPMRAPRTKCCAGAGVHGRAGRSAARPAHRSSRMARAVIPVDMTDVERIDFVCAGRAAQHDQPHRSAAQGGPDRRRVADHPGAAAAHRHFAAAFRQEGTVALAGPILAGRDRGPRPGRTHRPAVEDPRNDDNAREQASRR